MRRLCHALSRRSGAKTARQTRPAHESRVPSEFTACPNDAASSSCSEERDSSSAIATFTPASSAASTGIDDTSTRVHLCLQVEPVRLHEAESSEEVHDRFGMRVHERIGR